MPDYHTMQDGMDISQLSRPQKMQMMESLWADLARDDELIESPPWHAVALAETERRLQAGDEQIFEWSDAKEEIRRRLG